jgi:hypothetical protein
MYPDFAGVTPPDQSLINTFEYFPCSSVLQVSAAIPSRSVKVSVTPGIPLPLLFFTRPLISGNFKALYFSSAVAEVTRVYCLLKGSNL